MKETFVKYIKRLKEYSDTINQLEKMIDTNLGESVLGAMQDDIGALLLTVANPNLEGIHLDYFSEVLWNTVFTDEEVDFEAFFDEIKAGEAPAEYIAMYKHCY